MTIKALSYVRVTGADLDAWEHFATTILGLDPVRDGDRMTIRLDERAYRFDLRSSGPSKTVMGWDVKDARSLDDLRQALQKAGIEYSDGGAGELVDRQVLGLLSFADPDGLEHEVVCGAAFDAPPVTFSRHVTGYETGTLGLGHFAVGVPDLEGATEFYKDVLGFRSTDIMPGLFSFMRVNPRHHSIALMQYDRAEIHHMHLLANTLEDVGRAYDAALAGDLVRKSLGQHNNDGLVSFYCETPAGWEIEFGFGGIRVDDDEWLVRKVDRPFSLWGHNPVPRKD